MRNAVVFQLLCVHVQSGSEISTEVRTRSDLFWGILKDAKHLWAQGSPKTHWRSSVVQFKTELWGIFNSPLLRVTQILVWEKPAVSSCLLEETAQKSPSRCVIHSGEREGDYSAGRSCFSSAVKTYGKALLARSGFIQAKFAAGSGVPGAAPQCHPAGPRCCRHPRDAAAGGSLCTDRAVTPSPDGFAGVRGAEKLLVELYGCWRARRREERMDPGVQSTDVCPGVTAWSRIPSH